MEESKVGLNNFHGHLPGGDYRRMYEDLRSKPDRSGAHKNILEREEKIIKDIDRILVEIGFYLTRYEDIRKKNESNFNEYQRLRRSNALTDDIRAEMLEKERKLADEIYGLLKPVYDAMISIGYKHEDLVK